ncbi:hypothetical protein LEP1GSC103_3726 [Leptospira borgpetersenii serovar Javanica str. UI 09931]|uniref:Uncharacterized protein n=5 Tax=Leptospira borgpetersenii TaxID=174 RepID=M3GFX7_LEPBO|nr:hypothetical protein LBBP_00889 [Leptospira borgpetersenii serovar Ballum]AXX15627.1 hypothetical protein C4Q31_08795 [Leptospira borgpetersenii serovar Ceylonica]EKP15335.1 hypothetical protein LEP1GSC128_1958 [Leptospira borgpetersenii str. 200801926]EKQ98521.1 hypothetical protein LEP1GSC121_3386 [Leptospira borgpetersenii serovar Castellonis str. 200801910]EMF99866.1 hypothetical protein LEP1GSC123_3599 [Leptospira borgpetersenii str. 200701203]EMK09391.1 hypothetical protein LEP1GSC066
MRLKKPFLGSFQNDGIFSFFKKSNGIYFGLSKKEVIFNFLRKEKPFYFGNLKRMNLNANTIRTRRAPIEARR